MRGPGFVLAGVERAPSTRGPTDCGSSGGGSPPPNRGTLRRPPAELQVFGSSWRRRAAPPSPTSSPNSKPRRDPFPSVVGGSRTGSTSSAAAEQLIRPTQSSNWRSCSPRNASCPRGVNGYTSRSTSSVPNSGRNQAPPDDRTCSAARTRSSPVAMGLATRRHPLRAPADGVVPRVSDRRVASLTRSSQ